jgi:hypothetical protein
MRPRLKGRSKFFSNSKGKRKGKIRVRWIVEW